MNSYRAAADLVDRVGPAVNKVLANADKAVGRTGVRQCNANAQNRNSPKQNKMTRRQQQPLTARFVFSAKSRCDRKRDIDAQHGVHNLSRAWLWTKNCSSIFPGVITRPVVLQEVVGVRPANFLNAYNS